MSLHKRDVSAYLPAAIGIAVLLVVTLLLVFVGTGDDKKPKDDPVTSDSNETESDATQSDASFSDGTETTSDGKESTSDATESDGGETKSDGSKTTSDAEEIEYVEGDASYFWRRVPKTTVDEANPFLLLVNATHAIPDGYVDGITLTKVSGNYKLDTRIADAMKAMIAAAEKDGITISLCSAFRTNARQIELYTGRIATEQERDASLSFYDACLKAARTNALPGTSEHETGLCWDFNNLYDSFDKTEEFAWLQAHAAEYGFILRYPKDKQDITGIKYEPWHYRYVGVEAATEMKELGMCLEEYVEYFYNK